MVAVLLVETVVVEYTNQMPESIKLPTRYSKLAGYQRRKVREQYIKLQNGKCMFCNSPLSRDPPEGILANPIHLSLYPPGFLDNPIHLQHDHNTDMTEGAVHAYCNAVLWEYEKR